MVPITEQFLFTELRESDQDRAVQILNDPDVARGLVGGADPIGPDDFADTMETVRSKEARYGHFLYFAIRSCVDQGLVGAIMLDDVFGDQCVELGCYLDKSAWGKGVMTAAVGQVCDYAFCGSWKPQRHHDFIDVQDFPDCWRDQTLTVEVEAKAKEVAVLKLKKQLAETWFVYILRCADGSLYTGITNDLERRVEQHNAGTASRYTRSRLPVTLEYQDEARTKGAALKRELAIKALSRQAKETLIQSVK